MSAAKTRRRVPRVVAANVAQTDVVPKVERKERPAPVPFLLDFYPLEDIQYTRLAPFYERLKSGRLSTTRCRREDRLLWPPRVACPSCHTEELEWVDLPRSGTLYAFSAVLGGAPLGMEADVPFAVGLVDLDRVPLRLFGRVVGRPWTELEIGASVDVETFALDDGRWFFRFRAGRAKSSPVRASDSGAGSL
jgi:uncharacterized OB-fold protein